MKTSGEDIRKRGSEVAGGQVNGDVWGSRFVILSPELPVESAHLVGVPGRGGTVNGALWDLGTRWRGNEWGSSMQSLKNRRSGRPANIPKEGDLVSVTSSSTLTEAPSINGLS